MWRLRRVTLFLLLLSSLSDLSTGLCDVYRHPPNDGDLIAKCRTLKEAGLISARDLHTLNAVPEQKLLHSKTFQNFSSLKNLNLSKGNVKKIDPGAFSNLAHLETLNLEHNAIKELKFATFKGLNRLQSLNLRNNAISKLPRDLRTLKNLRSLDLAFNPLLCNCANLKVRDILLKRGVTISQSSLCSSPSVLKGRPFAVPVTNQICAFEKQDTEMLMDEPASDEGSGDDEEDYNDESLDSTDSTTKVTSEASSTSDDSLIVIDESKELESSNSTLHQSEEGSSNATAKVTSEVSRTSDDSLILIDDSKESESSNSILHQSEDSADVTKATVVDESEEGSGDDEGSGTGVPHIDWSQIQEETKEDTKDAQPSSTTEESFFDTFNNLPNKLFDMFGLLGTPAPEVKKEITESSSSSYLEEEQFFPISTDQSPSTEKETTKVETTTSTTIFIPIPKDDMSEKIITNDVNAGTKNEGGDVSQSRQSTKSMGSYLVLAALLAVLTCLIAYAAYRGDLCRSKKKRSDVENGTELKDLQKSLLDGNGSQPKVASNGNAEIVPLVSEKPFDRCDLKRSTDDLKLQDANEPVKPPRRSMQQEDFEKIKANGTNHQDFPELVRTFLSDSPTSKNMSGDYVDKPPVSPGAQRVKITLQDIPDSVPKTPVVITRLQNDGNLVKAP